VTRYIYTTEDPSDGGECDAEGHPRCNSTEEYARVVSVYHWDSSQLQDCACIVREGAVLLYSEYLHVLGGDGIFTLNLKGDNHQAHYREALN